MNDPRKEKLNCNEWVIYKFHSKGKTNLMHHIIIQAYNYSAVNIPWPPNAFVSRSITQLTTGQGGFQLGK